MSDSLQNIAPNVEQNQNVQPIIPVNEEANDRFSIIYMQRFTASIISLLDLLKDSCQSLQLEDEKEIRSRDKLLQISNKILVGLKGSNKKDKDNDNGDNGDNGDAGDDFNYGRLIKKAFYALREEKSLNLLKNKDVALFSLKDADGKIITIIPGVDLRFGYSHLNDDDKIKFWQYIYLFSSSVFNLISITNPTKIKSSITEMITYLNIDVAKTGIMIKNQIFNPFIGVGVTGGLSMEQLFEGGELPSQVSSEQVTIDAALKALGVEKYLNQEKLDEQLKNISDENIVEATDKITDFLGAHDNPEVKEVCNTLIIDIVNSLKENGTKDLGKTFNTIFQNAKNIDQKKMRQTAISMQNFMANSQEKLMSMKDEHGNPIGANLLQSLSLPMQMAEQLAKKQAENNKKIDQVD